MDTSEDNYLTAPDKCLTEDEARAQCAFLSAYANDVFKVANSLQTSEYSVMRTFGELKALRADITERARYKDWMLEPVLDSIYERALRNLHSHADCVQNEEMDSMKLLIMTELRLVHETSGDWFRLVWQKAK